jgi:hypothetical protein
MSDGNALKRTHNAAGAAASSHGATPTDVPHSATRNIDATESARSTSRPPVQYAAGESPESVNVNLCELTRSFVAVAATRTGTYSNATGTAIDAR